MRRKFLPYLLMLVLLLSQLPATAAAQGKAPSGEAPTGQPTAPLQIEVLTPAAEGEAVEGEAAKAAVSGTSFDGLLTPDGMSFFNETEPNGTPATANALPGNDIAVLGNVFPNGDQDYFSFSGNAGDRVYAATMTSFSASASVDSYLTLFASDGTTVIEDDNDNGSFGSTSSSIAGATLPASGTYYLQVRHNSATNQLRPYRLHLRVQSGSPVAETEPNETPATANPLPPSGWVSGSTSAATDLDYYSLSLNAGDSVFLSLDLDPERDTTEWNAQLGLGVFNNFILVVNDAGTAGPDSEAFFITVKDAGTYYVLVSAPTGGTTFGTYNLSASVLPKAQQAYCTTYTSTDVPKVIPSGPGMVSSTLVVPGNPRIADIDVSIVLTHTFMADLDAHLVSPAGNDNGLFTDVGNVTVGSANIQMNTTLDDEAAIPIGQFTVVAGPSFTPELNYRLSWYDYTNAGGVWTLKLYDDATGDGGVLQSWSITICEPPPPPTCPVGYNPVIVYSSDFEAGDGGFTHFGTQDEWERGLPTFAPITTCNSGSNCWKTDLDNTYNPSSDQTLLSPPINLAGYNGPVILRWAQKYQMESATFDGAYGQVQQVGGANPTRLWTWLDATMSSTVGNPSTTIQESAGWGERWADISSYAGQSIEAVFNLTSDTTVQFAGLAIDDVSVTACQQVFEPSIVLTKTVGLSPLSCATTDQINLPYGGDNVTYCYEVENTGNISFNTHDLTDSQLGPILTGYSYLLAPGATAFITETAYIGVTTVNTGTWTAYNTNEGGGGQATASDTATVTVDLPAPAIVLTKTVGTDATVCATTDDITVPANTNVTYCYTVENTGNVSFNTHDLNDSELGTILNNFFYNLAPGASAFITATTNIAVTTVNTATWYAELVPQEGFPSAQATDVATVTVQAPNQPAIDLNKTVGTVPGVCATTNKVTVPAGTEVYYCYQIENTGNVTFTYHSLVDSELGTLATNLPYVLPPGAFSPPQIVPETINITTTNVATWTAVSSLGGYVVDTNATYNYIPINTSGTALGLSDDGEANINIPWGATFFGFTSNNLRVGNNGGILFNATTGDVPVTNAALPIASPALSILPFWDDIDSDTGNVYWEVQGTTPNRMLIVEWYNRPHFSNIGSATFEAILYEATNEIKFQYADVDFGDPLYNNGVSATVGINKDATTALQVSFNQPVIQNGQAILFTPAQILTATDSDFAEVNVIYPQIDVDPLLFDVKVGAGLMATRTLTITNVGQAPLDWDIAEENIPAPPAPDAPNPNADPAQARELVGPTDGLKPDELTPAALSSWSRPAAVLYDNGPLVTNPGAGAGGADASALQGGLGLTIYGFGHAISSGFRMADDFTVPAGGWTISQITFFAYQTGSTTTSTLNNVNLRIWDGPPNLGTSTVVFGDTTTNRLASTTWTNSYRVLDTALTNNQRPIMADVVTVNTTLPAGTYWLDWQTGGTLASGPWAPPVSILGQTAKPGANGLQYDPTAATWNPALDTTFQQDLPFVIEGTSSAGVDCLLPSDIPWLTVTPISGTLAGGNSQAVALGFDATSLVAGVYTGNLCITSNDPDAGPGNGTDLVIVPVTLTVNTPTAVTLANLTASGAVLDKAQLPLPFPASLPVAVLPTAAGLAMAAVYALRRRR